MHHTQASVDALTSSGTLWLGAGRRLLSPYLSWLLATRPELARACCTIACLSGLMPSSDPWCGCSMCLCVSATPLTAQCALCARFYTLRILGQTITTSWASWCLGFVQVYPYPRKSSNASDVVVFIHMHC